MSWLAAFRRPGLLLLLPLMLAMAARIFVAPGWMIASDTSGTITVRVCSDPANPGGTITIPIDRAADHDSGEAQQHCPWGALAAAPIVPAAPQLPLLLVPHQAAPVAIPALGYAPGIASPLPPSTGPPLQA